MMMCWNKEQKYIGYIIFWMIMIVEGIKYQKNVSHTVFTTDNC